MHAEHRSGISLADLLTRRRFFQAADIVVSSCCADHRHCQPGDLFVATINSDIDGHDYAQDAIDRGAVAILTERLLPLQIPQCIVPSTKTALAHLCQRLAGAPANQIPVLGVAGRSGKTATQVLLANLLDAAGQRPAIFGSRSYSDGFDAYPRKSPKTSPARYAQWLANVVANGCSHAVTTLPQRNVAHSTYSGVPLNTLVLTGFESRTHKSKLSPKNEAYLKHIVTEVPTTGMIVANVDCPVIRNVIDTINRPLLTVSLGGNADITANIVEQFPSEQMFLLDAGHDTAVVRTKTIGDQYVRYCLLATAVGLGIGVNLETIVGGLEAIEGIPGMLDRVECGQPFSVFADTCRSKMDLKNTIHTLRKVTRGRLICVFGPGQAEPATRAQRGSTVERFADLSVITSDDAYDAQPLRAIHDVLDGYANPARAHVIPNRLRAIEWALNQAQPGDTLLMAGPHNARIIRDETDFLADADVARYWLYESANKMDLGWVIPPR